MRATSEELKLFEDQMKWYFSYQDAFVKKEKLQESSIESFALEKAKFKALHQEFIQFRNHVKDLICHGLDDDVQPLPGYIICLYLYAEEALTNCYTEVLRDCIFPKGWESMYKSQLTTVTDD